MKLATLLLSISIASIAQDYTAASSGSQGPAKELIDAVVEMKRRNPGWGCPRIAEQIALAFGVEIDKDVVDGSWPIIIGRNRMPEVLRG
jgi:hypothetical protein